MLSLVVGVVPNLLDDVENVAADLGEHGELRLWGVLFAWGNGGGGGGGGGFGQPGRWEITLWLLPCSELLQDADETFDVLERAGGV